MKSKAIIATGILLAVGLLALGLCVRSGLKSFNDSQRTVEVKGLATREVPANKVTWPISIKQVGNDLPAVYSQVTSTNQAIVEFLKSNGLSDNEISIGAPQMTDYRTRRYNNDPIPYNFSVSSVVTVSSTQVDKVRQLINRQGELLTGA